MLPNFHNLLHIHKPFELHHMHNIKAMFSPLLIPHTLKQYILLLPKMRKTTPTLYYHFPGTKEEEELQNYFRNVSAGSQPQRLPCEFVETNSQAPLLLHLFPWEIKKTITENDLDPQVGLELDPSEAREHLLRHWVDWTDQYQLNNGQTVLFQMVDLDTNTEHLLTFRKWPNGERERYFIHENWIKDFVRRRNLRVGMLVGMYWDIRTKALRFSVLSPAAD